MVNEYNLPTEFYGVLVGEIWHLLFSLFLLCLFTSLNNLCASWINKELQWVPKQFKTKCENSCASIEVLYFALEYN